MKKIIKVTNINSINFSKKKTKNKLTQSHLAAMFQEAKKFSIFICNSIFFKCVRPSECFFRAPDDDSPTTSNSAANI